MNEVGMIESEMSLQTEKQRRNVIGISFVIILIEWADIHFEPSGIWQGFTYSVGNPIAIYWALNIVLAYFFVRFMQCFVAYRAWSKLRNSFEIAILNGRTDAVITRLSKRVQLKQEIMSDDQLQMYCRNLYRTGFTYKLDKDGLETTLSYRDPSDVTSIAKHEFSLLWIYYVVVKSFIRWVVFDTFLTDYYVPLFIALFAIYIGLYA